MHFLKNKRYAKYITTFSSKKDKVPFYGDKQHLYDVGKINRLLLVSAMKIMNGKINYQFNNRHYVLNMCCNVLLKKDKLIIEPDDEYNTFYICLYNYTCLYNYITGTRTCVIIVIKYNKITNKIKEYYLHDKRSGKLSEQKHVTYLC